MSVAIKHGVYLGGFLVAYGLFFRILGLHYTSPLGWVFYLALPVATFLSLSSQSKKARQTFVSAFFRGSLTVLVGSLLYSVYVYGFNAFIDDSLIQSVRADQLAALDPNSPDAEKRAALNEMVTTPAGFAISIFVQLAVVGVFLAAIIAPFVRSKKAAT